jgi:hypothetical protein
MCPRAIASYTLVQVYRAAMTPHSNMTISCSLTPAEYADRLHEFHQLFATSLRHVRREPTRLVLTLDAETAREAEVRDLLRREQECCPFFGFEVQLTSDGLVLEARVPDGADECLDDLERLTEQLPPTRA